MCKRLEGIGVDTSLLDKKPISYSNFQVQSRVSSSSKLMYYCSITLETNTINDPTASFSDNSTSNTNLSNCNIDTPVISTTDSNNHEFSIASTNSNLNATDYTIINTSDEYNKDIE
ncbi:hypothetical protein BY458DRAFT_492391 [Sporodiniella umbellata]|nr:hypothetical protein BY458DRAFT_492391 [Sporodiniella umbellata]